jgi:MerR family transcriptional regulator/heat shock protein HspR
MEKDEKQGLYVISVAARLTEVHPQTLRMYERKGLLCPERAGNRRRYSDDDIMRLRRIQELTHQGLNLSGVARVLAMEEEISSLRDQMASMQAEMAEAHRQMRQEMMEVKRHMALSVKPPQSLMRRRQSKP